MRASIPRGSEHGWSCEPHSLACGTCHLCRRGFAELCANKRSPGWGIDGAFADGLAMPAHLLHRVPDGLSDRVAALAEPMAVSVTALARAGVQAGDIVLIVGPGPIGILLAAGAIAMGAATVVVAGRHDSDRLRFAGTIGALTVLGDAAVEPSRTRPPAGGQTWSSTRPDRPRRSTSRSERSGAEVGSLAVGMSGQPVVSGPVGSGGHPGRRCDVLDELERHGVGPGDHDPRANPAAGGHERRSSRSATGRPRSRLSRADGDQGAPRPDDRRGR